MTLSASAVLQRRPGVGDVPAEPAGLHQEEILLRPQHEPDAAGGPAAGLHGGFSHTPAPCSSPPALPGAPLSSPGGTGLFFPTLLVGCGLFSTSGSDLVSLRAAEWPWGAGCGGPSCVVWLELVAVIWRPLCVLRVRSRQPALSVPGHSLTRELLLPQPCPSCSSPADKGRARRVLLVLLWSWWRNACSLCSPNPVLIHPAARGRAGAAWLCQGLISEHVAWLRGCSRAEPGPWHCRLPA